MSDSTVTLDILGKQYQIKAPPEKRELLEQVNRHLNKRMREAKEQHHLNGMENIAIMTALNLTYEMINQQQSAEKQNKQIQRISKKIDELT